MTFLPPIPNSTSHTLNIVYQDDDIIAVNKPPELLCVPGLSSPDNLFDLVKKQFPNARVVHRLDMSTSGLVLFALHYEAQKALGKSFEKRKIHKRYSAIVSGLIDAQCGEIESKMMCDWPNRPKQKIDWIEGKHATTYFEIEETLQLSKLNKAQPTNTQLTTTQLTKVRLSPLTGRTHQLRLHMWQIGHPIIGDRLYHNETSRAASQRMCLHAQELFFTHPISKSRIHIECDANFQVE